VPRPTVVPDLFASLVPPEYSGRLEPEALKAAKPAEAPREEAARPLRGMMGGMARAGGAAAGPASYGPASYADASRKALEERMELGRSVSAAASASRLGDFFQYVLDRPVSLPRQKSALLPVVGKDVRADRVSVYNESVQPKFPLLGLRFKNTTGLHLMQGPVTVFEGGRYAGDARLPDLQPGEERLVAFAVDLGTEVSPEDREPSQRLVSVRVRRGIIETNNRLHEERVYRLANRSDKDRTVLVEHPYRPQFKLVPEKKVETTREVYRFPVAVKAKGNAELKVVEEMDQGSQVAISNSDDNGSSVVRCKPARKWLGSPPPSPESVRRCAAPRPSPGSGPGPALSTGCPLTSGRMPASRSPGPCC
jgi:hypothetical protein